MPEPAATATATPTAAASDLAAALSTLRRLDEVLLEKTQLAQRVASARTGQPPRESSAAGVAVPDTTPGDTSGSGDGVTRVARASLVSDEPLVMPERLEQLLAADDSGAAAATGGVGVGGSGNGGSLEKLALAARLADLDQALRQLHQA
jgi:hypothetical protein